MRTTLFVLAGEHHGQRQVHVRPGGEKGAESVPGPPPAPPAEPIRDDKGQIMRAVEPVE